MGHKSHKAKERRRESEKSKNSRKSVESARASATRDSQDGRRDQPSQEPLAAEEAMRESEHSETTAPHSHSSVRCAFCGNPLAARGFCVGVTGACICAACVERCFHELHMRYVVV